MNRSDVEPGRAGRAPDRRIVLLASGTGKSQGIVIKQVELRLYVERKDEHLGKYSLLTVIVETDSGTVEMKYDEGFRGEDALDTAAKMLTQYSGLASLINRALIELKRQEK
jgi:hypothetical protein